MEKVTPGIETAVVKRALSRTGGWIVPPKRAAVIIADAAERAAANVRDGAVQVIDAAPPFRIEIDLRTPLTDEGRAAFERFPAYELVGERTVRFQHDEMAVAYRMAAITGSIAGGAAVRSY
jgi:D-aminopeptidase